MPYLYKVHVDALLVNENTPLHRKTCPGQYWLIFSLGGRWYNLGYGF